VALETPIWIEATGTDTPILLSARQYRTLLDAIWLGQGVVRTGHLAVSQRAAGANMSVDVSTGLVVWLGESVANQGHYVARNTAVLNVAVAAAPLSGSRTDLIIAQLYDNQADSSGQYAWNIFPLTGTTTAPDNAVVLARVTLTSTTTSITNAAISTTGREYVQLAQVYRPVASYQVTDLTTFSTFGSFVDFSGGQWPSLTFTVPASGQVNVTVSADIFNVNTTTSTIWAAWRVSSGTLTWTNSNALSAAGGRVYASRRTLCNGTPGTSVTLIPQWNVSSSSTGNTQAANGALVVEPVQ
jgi:hypothetical protein